MLKYTKSGDEVLDIIENIYNKFNIDSAYVKPKHLSTSGGNGAKFLGSTKAEAESILKNAMKKKNILKSVEDGVTSQGNKKFTFIIDAGETIGTKGENYIKIILSDDGGMLSAFPVKGVD